MTEFVETYASDDSSTTRQARDGIEWWEAAMPRRLHRCRAQTRGFINYFTLVERCACGAIQMGGGAWLNRNSKKKASQGTRGVTDMTDTIRNTPLPSMPEPPAGTEWDVEVKPGRTSPTEVTVKLRKQGWPRKVIGERSSHCGSFFNKPSDEPFFKMVVSGLAVDILNPPEDPSLRMRWFREMQSNA